MKKIVSFILALAMAASMSAAAFAATEYPGTTILTVEIPELKPSYTMHIPASQNLEYGNTGYQELGEVYVSDVRDIWAIWCYCKYTDLVNTMEYSGMINTTGQIDQIPLTLYDYFENDYKEYDKSSGSLPGGAPQIYWVGGKNTDGSDKENWKDCYAYPNHKMFAKVSDWSNAKRGNTYQSTITYELTVLRAQ